MMDEKDLKIQELKEEIRNMKEELKEYRESQFNGRLTAREEANGCAYYPYCFLEEACDGESSSEKCRSCRFNESICERLARYEDLDEKGLINEWVPVVERLPEEGEMVLVTCVTKKGLASVNRAYHSDNTWHGSGSMSGVVAWMDMPEPYKEDV